MFQLNARGALLPLPALLTLPAFNFFWEEEWVPQASDYTEHLPPPQLVSPENSQHPALPIPRLAPMINANS